MWYNHIGDSMKKLFGGINLTWSKLIIFAVLVGVYTAAMTLIPVTNDTSFRDIAISFECWILFGIIIICNSKSPVDSALKCFVFFLISQPLVYLIQVPFNDMGWGLFGYYRYWFYWTLACLPMGFFGYYIKAKNILSVLILTPIIIALTFIGLGYINTAIESFPYHLLSGIFCFALIIVIALYLFDKKVYRFLILVITLVAVAIITVINGGIMDSQFETYNSLDEYNLSLVGKAEVTSFSGTKKGKAEVINSNEAYTLKMSGYKKGNYSLTISDEAGNEYYFEYYFDKEKKTVILKQE